MFDLKIKRSKTPIKNESKKEVQTQFFQTTNDFNNNQLKQYNQLDLNQIVETKYNPLYIIDNN